MGYYALSFYHTNAVGLPMDQYDANLDWAARTLMSGTALSSAATSGCRSG